MTETDLTPSLDEIVALCKRRGFVFPTSEIYGGLANSYEYGPLGVELVRNIRNLWWKNFITARRDMVGLDSQILLHPQTWVASGHVSAFNDPLVEDLVTHKRYRADHLIEAWLELRPGDPNQSPSVSDMNVEEMADFIKQHGVKSPEGNPLSAPKNFNLLFETSIGAVAGEKALVYLRGETAQGIFTNFKQVVDSTRVKLPFGIGQIGKSFRNEVTTGQFIFRTLEFEQAEIEYFFDPEVTPWQDLMAQWQKDLWRFLTTECGVDSQHLRWRQHSDKERSHYSQDTYDLDYHFPFGWKELWGLAYRTDYDLKQHAQFSGQELLFTDPVSQKRLIPHVIEPAVGLNRLLLMILTEGFWQDEAHQRLVLKIKPQLAPHQVAVFPLVKNKPELIAKAESVFQNLSTKFRVVWDDRGNIGKRYLSQDEIGTPWCLTIDYQTLEDNTLTVRDRDTTAQHRINIDQLESHLQKMID